MEKLHLFDLNSANSIYEDRVGNAITKVVNYGTTYTMIINRPKDAPPLDTYDPTFTTDEMKSRWQQLLIDLESAKQELIAMDAKPFVERTTKLLEATQAILEEAELKGDDYLTKPEVIKLLENAYKITPND